MNGASLLRRHQFGPVVCRGRTLLVHTASAPSRDYIAGAVVMWGPIEHHVSGMRAHMKR
jgi:hypothetical protein